MHTHVPVRSFDWLCKLVLVKICALWLVGCAESGCPAGSMAMGGRCIEACTPTDEVCDGVDNDCDGVVDNGFSMRAFYRDADGDGFGDMTMSMQACEAPSGYVMNQMDCDDGCASCNPDGREVCDESMRDENCDRRANEGCECTIAAVRPCASGSDIGECSLGTQTCTEAGTWGDCSGARAPMAETCNGLDDDCNGTADDGSALASCGVPSRNADTATVVCKSGGGCGLTCKPNHDDCNDMFDDACETEFGTLSNCTECGEACAFACAEAGCNDAAQIVAGNYHFGCVRQIDGRAMCWGANVAGQLGNGTMTDSMSPTFVSGLEGALQLSAGHGFVCARVGTTGNNVRCWGDATWGQLGSGAGSVRTTLPATGIAVAGVPNFTATSIGAGVDHMCAIVAGNVWCWGRTEDGQCGILAESNIVLPRNVTSGLAVRGTFARVMGGQRHTCALTTSGAVYCWGRNAEGQIGNGATSTMPVLTPSLAIAANVQEIAVGDLHSCARMSDGTVSCWGDNRDLQLGVSGHAQVATPVQVVGISGATSIAAGGWYSCAVSAGTVRCWGKNDVGQLGNGTAGDSSSRPQSVAGIETAVEVELGSATSCARLENGGVRCWGYNARGALGCRASVGQTCAVTVQ